MAAVGVLCAVARSLVLRDHTLSLLFLGIGTFCYGGIVGLLCYVFVGSLMVLTTATLRGQRAGEILAALVGAAAWIGFVVTILGRWPQVCAAGSIAIVAIFIGLARLNWKVVEGPSPESSLRRLLAAKQNCPHQAPHRDPGSLKKGQA
jgi:hypothetical protein